MTTSNDILKALDLSKVPSHIAIIMDGNGRWAQKQGEERLFGHNFGVEAVRETLKGAKEIGVKYLTLYAFSTENWNRPKDEVDGLMDLLVRTIANEVDELHANNVVIRSIGCMDELPQSFQEKMREAQERTKNNTGVHFILALNYSSRWDIKNATQQLITKARTGELPATTIIDDALISAHLSTAGTPDPELLIRTSGELRISNFLLWEIAYAELYFTDVLWPDFKANDLYKAVLEYQSRERRFGMVSEQITP